MFNGKSGLFKVYAKGYKITRTVYDVRVTDGKEEYLMYDGCWYPADWYTMVPVAKDNNGGD